MPDSSPHSELAGIVRGALLSSPKFEQAHVDALNELEEQLETVRRMVQTIIERDDICPLCEWIPGTRDEQRKHYDYCPMGVPYPASRPSE